MINKSGLVLVLFLLAGGLALTPAGSIEAKNDNADGPGKSQAAKGFGLTNVFKSWFKTASSTENNDDDYNYKLDDRLPPGLRQAPGIEKRVETGKGLPFGWWLKLFGSGTTTPPGMEVDGLKISALVSAAGTSTAVISWQTNKPADAKVYYSTTSPATIDSQVAMNSSLVTSHAVSLTGLLPNTTYYYFVTSTSDGKTATSGPRSLTTTPLPVVDTRAPEIIFNTVINVSSSSVRLIWVTDEAAGSRAWVAATAPVSTAGPATASDDTLVYYHDLTVSNLTASTTYHYTLSSADGSGNIVTLADKIFTTTE